MDHLQDHLESSLDCHLRSWVPVDGTRMASQQFSQYYRHPSWRKVGFKHDARLMSPNCSSLESLDSLCHVICIDEHTTHENQHASRTQNTIHTTTKTDITRDLVKCVEWLRTRSRLQTVGPVRRGKGFVFFDTLYRSSARVTPYQSPGALQLGALPRRKSSTEAEAHPSSMDIYPEFFPY